ncbi:MAG TPA: hypothetical protein VGC03_07115 [Acidimicrobiia bacterium]
MSRSLVGLGLALVLLVAACSEGSGGESEPTISDQTPTTVVETTATVSPGTSPPSSDRQAAPDFTLQLGDGGSYTLSEGAKPVYLVFWAEW